MSDYKSQDNEERIRYIIVDTKVMTTIRKIEEIYKINLKIKIYLNLIITLVDNIGAFKYEVSMTGSYHILIGGSI